MTEMATQFCEILPPEQLSVADILAIKKNAYPDIDAIFGLQPSPRETVILLHVTEGTTMSYLGVEEHGWEIIVSFDIEESPSIEAAVTEHIETAVEWAETYYSSETFAFLDRRG